MCRRSARYSGWQTRNASRSASRRLVRESDPSHSMDSGAATPVASRGEQENRTNIDSTRPTENIPSSTNTPSADHESHTRYTRLQSDTDTLTHVRDSTRRTLRRAARTRLLLSRSTRAGGQTKKAAWVSRGGLSSPAMKLERPLRDLLPRWGGSCPADRPQRPGYFQNLPHTALDPPAAARSSVTDASEVP
jgi:hypothetical protein